MIGPSSASISLPPWTLLGFRADGRPIYNVAGGSEDDDGTDIEVGDDTSDDEPADEDDEPSDGDGTDADDKPKPKPPAPKADPVLEKLQAEHARTVAALKKANDEAKRSRLALKELEAKGRANEGDHERAIREATEAVENQWKPRIINQAARAALAEAGVAGGPARVLKLLDTDALTVDDDGDVIGLDSEIDRLRTDYPELFARPEPAKPKARPTAAPKPPAPDKPKSSWEQHAARLRGN
ncbi:phage scaffolding protein [Kitasatospora sp. NPDC047058]|uniref:phage scaffolding protein n=1 Tax=Kitasatospora sp. NPDC047058 TaxID=3155620 RepID=UPI0033BFF82B